MLNQCEQVSSLLNWEPPEPDSIPALHAESYSPETKIVSNVTADIPLAARCLAKQARVLDPKGRPFTDKDIGSALALRDLMNELRQGGTVTGGPTAMTAREALRLATRGGAGLLRRDDIGTLEPGKRADIAVWATDRLELGGAEDLVAGLVLSGPHRVDRLLVGGEEVVRGGALVRANEEEIALEHRKEAARLWR